MQGYSKGSVWSFITFHNNAWVEASTQACSKGSLVLFIPVHYYC
jgi:hypothetical protein